MRAEVFRRMHAVAAALLLIVGMSAVRAAPAVSYSVQRADGAWTIVCATNGAPQGAVSNAVAVFFADYPRIAEHLGVDATGVPRRLELQFDEGRPANQPAATAGARMAVSSGHVLRHPDDLRGLLIHEWTHTVQAYPDPQPGWITEGLADAVRLLLSAEDDPWRRRVESAPRRSTDYRRGYGDAARFLLWVRGRGQPALLAELNAAMRNRTYREGWWAERTGRTLDLWWTDYLEQERNP